MAFPSATAAEAFVNDPGYAPFVAARRQGSESRFQLIDQIESLIVGDCRRGPADASVDRWSVRSAALPKW